MGDRLLTLSKAHFPRPSDPENRASQKYDFEGLQVLRIFHNHAF